MTAALFSAMACTPLPHITVIINKINIKLKSSSPAVPWSHQKDVWRDCIREGGKETDRGLDMKPFQEAGHHSHDTQRC